MTDEEYERLPIVHTFDPSEVEGGGISIPDPVPTQIAVPNPWLAPSSPSARPSEALALAQST